MSPLHQTRNRWCGEQGSVTIMTAILMLGLVLVIGLSIDVSRIYMLRAGLQNAADAAALAAARELNSGSDGLTDAVTQAQAAIGNQYGLSRAGGVATPTAVITTVQFAADLGGPWYTGASAATPFASTIRFVRVTTEPATITMLFAARVLGSTSSVQATATAGMSPGLNTICDYVPLAVAKASPEVPFDTGTEFTFQFVSAQSEELVDQDMIVLQTNGSESANLTRESVAGLNPVCTTIGATVLTSTSESAQGNNGPTQIEVGLNSRMGQYSHGMKAQDAGPDNNVYQDPDFGDFNWLHYRAASPSLLPPVATRPYASDNRRVIVMPIVETGAIDGAVTIRGFGAFLLLRKVVNPNPSMCNDIPNPCGEVHVEYIGDGFSIGAGYYDPTGACTTLTKAVLYK